MTHSDLPALLFGLMFSGVATLFLNQYLKGQHDRAAARDHVVETSRDVAVPDHCVSCGIAHASESVRVYTRFIGVSPFAVLFDSRLKRWFPFLFCRACAVPVLRRRKRGKAIGWIGWLMLAAACAIVALASTGMFRGHIEIVFVMMAFFVGWVAFFIWGLWLDNFAAAPIVSILDSGGETVFFRFRNQVFRNHFAELNGEK